MIFNKIWNINQLQRSSDYLGVIKCYSIEINYVDK